MVNVGLQMVRIAQNAAKNQILIFQLQMMKKEKFRKESQAGFIVIFTS